jgi:hypothetical protein
MKHEFKYRVGHEKPACLISLGLKLNFLSPKLMRYNEKFIVKVSTDILVTFSFHYTALV